MVMIRIIHFVPGLGLMNRYEAYIFLHSFVIGPNMMLTDESKGKQKTSNNINCRRIIYLLFLIFFLRQSPQHKRTRSNT